MTLKRIPNALIRRTRFVCCPPPRKTWFYHIGSKSEQCGIGARISIRKLPPHRWNRGEWHHAREDEVGNVTVRHQENYCRSKKHEINYQTTGHVKKKIKTTRNRKIKVTTRLKNERKQIKAVSFHVLGRRSGTKPTDL